ncbi:MAG: hypothetical protein FD177_2575 [Desulfovibrionaceae bacterium]|nr:MAG: hypothetical protein FD177_2575 [Desulfovibrionaceae bacterium]
MNAGLTFRGEAADSLVRDFLGVCLASPNAVDLRAMQLHQAFVTWCRESKGLPSEKMLNLRSFNVNCREHGVLLRRLHVKHDGQRGLA